MSHLITRLRVYTIGLFSSIALRLLSATWKIETKGLSELDKRLAENENLIAVFWHGKYYPLLPVLRNRKVCVFTSISFRGAVIADILRRYGYMAVQLPDHGGEISLSIMRTALKKHHAAAIAVDGPLGPYHVVHRGAIQLASELGFSIVPLSIAASRKKILNERWDYFELPRMFSKIQLVVGEPIDIPDADQAPALDLPIASVKQALENMDEHAIALLNECP